MTITTPVTRSSIEDLLYSFLLMPQEEKMRLLTRPGSTFSEKIGRVVAPLIQEGAAFQFDLTRNLMKLSHRQFFHSKIRAEVGMSRVGYDSNMIIENQVERRIYSFFYNLVRKTGANFLFKSQGKAVLRQKPLFGAGAGQVNAVFQVNPCESESAVKKAFNGREVERLHSSVANPVFTSERAFSKAKELMSEFRDKLTQQSGYKKALVQYQEELEKHNFHKTRLKRSVERKNQFVNDKKKLTRQIDQARASIQTSSRSLAEIEKEKTELLGTMNEYMQVRGDKKKQAMGTFTKFGQQLSRGKTKKRARERTLTELKKLSDSSITVDDRLKKDAKRLFELQQESKASKKSQLISPEKLAEIKTKIAQLEKQLAQLTDQLKIVDQLVDTYKKQEQEVTQNLMPKDCLELFVSTITECFLSFKDKMAEQQILIDHEHQAKDFILKFTEDYLKENGDLSTSDFGDKLCNMLYQKFLATPVAFGPRSLLSIEAGITYLASKAMNQADAAVEKKVRGSWTKDLEQYSHLNEAKLTLLSGLKALKESAIQMGQNAASPRCVRAYRQEFADVFGEDDELETRTSTILFKGFVRDLNEKLQLTKGAINLPLITVLQSGFAKPLDVEKMTNGTVKVGEVEQAEKHKDYAFVQRKKEELRCAFLR